MFLVNIQRISWKSCGALPRVRGVWLCAFAFLILAVPKGLVAQTGSSVPQGIHKIKHVIIIMQENRSFDSYFGTFPGADGLPTKDGAFTVCNPDLKTGQ